MNDISVYPLRLPRSLKNEVARLSRKDGTSINQFVMAAVTAKVAAMETAEYFLDRKAPADFSAFDRLMSRRAAGAAAGWRRTLIVPVAGADSSPDFTAAPVV